MKRACLLMAATALAACGRSGPDLDTTASCGDCTALPQVAQAVCEAGVCKTVSCEPDDQLESNSCIPVFAAPTNLTASADDSSQVRLAWVAFGAKP